MKRYLLIVCVLLTGCGPGWDKDQCFQSGGSAWTPGHCIYTNPDKHVTAEQLLAITQAVIAASHDDD